ncbi:MAG: Hsp70 family protein, partial [Planctomycetota bacterium]
KNQAEHIIDETDKQVAEHGDKLDDEDKQAIEEAKQALAKAAQGDDKAAIDAALQTFQEKAQKLGQVIYEAAQKEQAAETQGSDAEASSGQASDDEPVDADFEVKS